MNGERRMFELPTMGLACDGCGTQLPGPDHTRTSPGFIFRERICPKCGLKNVTSERVIATRQGRSRRLTSHHEDFL